MTLDTVPAPPSGAGTGVSMTARRRGSKATTRSRLGSASGVSLGVVTMWLSLVVLLPLAAVVGKAFGSGWHSFYAAISNRETAAALRLTLELGLGVAVVNAVMGTLVAWVLVRERFPGAGLLEFVIDLPFALPTIVAGVVMLGLYGGNSAIGIHLTGTRTVLFIALMFVTLPFVVRTVQPVLLDLDREAEQAAASLGAGPITTFRRIVLPPLVPAIASGATLSFARAIGEYGSLTLISGNIPYHTLIVSSLIYGKLEDADHPQLSTLQAAAIATVLLAASAVVLVVLATLQRRLVRRG